MEPIFNLVGYNLSFVLLHKLPLVAQRAGVSLILCLCGFNCSFLKCLFSGNARFSYVVLFFAPAL